RWRTGVLVATPPRGPPPRRRSARTSMPRALQRPRSRANTLRRTEELKRIVPAGTPLLIQLRHRLGEAVERRVVGELPGHEPDPLGQLLPHRVIERRARVLLHRIVNDLREVLVFPVPPGEPDQGKPRRHPAAVGRVSHRRHQLLAGQVAGDAEQHKHARAGHPRDTPVPRVAQRVRGAHRLDPVALARAAPSTWRSPAARSRRCSRTAGLLRWRSAPTAPSAWASWSLPSVKSRPGTGTSAVTAPVICRNTPFCGPPLWYCPVECRNRGAQPKVTGWVVRPASASRSPAAVASPSRSR